MLSKSEFVTVTQGCVLSFTPVQQASFSIDLFSSYLICRLLLSGDVEQNPGPGRREAKRVEPSTTDYTSTYEIIDLPVAQRNVSESIDISKPQQSESPGSRSKACSLSPRLNPSSYKNSPYVSHATTYSASCDPTAVTEVNKVSQGPSTSLSPISSMPKTSFKDIVEKRPHFRDTQRSYSCEVTVQDYVHREMMSGAFRTTARQVVILSEDERIQQLTKFKDGMTKLLQYNDGWSHDNGILESNPDLNFLYRFFYLANQIITYNKGVCTVCLLCGRKTEDCHKIKRPIFQETLMEPFTKIHGEKAGIMGAISNTSLLLFCDVCETKTKISETDLRHLYLAIMDPEHQDEQIEVVEPEWLFRILATIMFRGIFGRNLLGEIKHSFKDLIHVVTRLRSYIMQSCAEMSQVPKDLKETFCVYILANGSFSLETEESNHLLNQYLRLPQPTSIVQLQRGSFLYTHFDCIHCVLPYSGTPIQGQDLSSNCFDARFISSDTNSILIPSSQYRRRVFPDFLIKENLRHMLNQQIESAFINDENCTFTISDSHRTQEYRSFKTGILQTDNSSIRQFKLIVNERECSQICSRAQKESPFPNELQREKIEKQQHSDLSQKEEGVTSWRERERFESKIAVLISKIAKLEEENKRLKRELQHATDHECL